MSAVEQKVAQFSGHGRIHKAFGGSGPLKLARENAHGVLAPIGRCFGNDVDPHSDDCNHATKMLEDLRALGIGGSQ